jgi:hypothetical protein
MNSRNMLVVMAGLCAMGILAGCARQHRVIRHTEGAPAPAPVPTAGVKIVIDSSDSQGVERQGDWPEGQGGEDHGTGCLFAFKGKGECKFIWRPDLPEAGDYRVSVWYGGDPNSDHATDSPFTVYWATGKQTFKLDQTKSSGGWKALGVFPFKAGKSGYVELTNNANGNVVADAVQFELVK